MNKITEAINMKKTILAQIFVALVVFVYPFHYRPNLSWLTW